MMARSISRPHGQRGVSLIFALITLVSLMLAAIALVRSVDSGSKILGNIGFQQDTTATADIAVAEATAWLTNATSDLTVSSGATKTSPADSRTGFYARVIEPLDATGQQMTSAAQLTTRQLIDWDLDSCAYASGTSPAGCSIIPHDVTSGTSKGTMARYVILRLCSADGASGTCSVPPTGGAASGSSKDECEVGNEKCTRLGSSSGQYYRIIVRVVGARDTTSFTETIVQY